MVFMHVRKACLLWESPTLRNSTSCTKDQNIDTQRAGEASAYGIRSAHRFVTQSKGRVPSLGSRERYALENRSTFGRDTKQGQETTSLYLQSVRVVCRTRWNPRWLRYPDDLVPITPSTSTAAASVLLPQRTLSSPAQYVCTPLRTPPQIREEEEKVAA